MEEILKDETVEPKQAMVNAAFFGVGRLRDSLKKVGEGWAMVITAVLVKQEDRWKFHTIHWSMPAE